MATFLSCAGSSERNPCEHRYGVVFSYTVDPFGHLTHFEYLRVINCENQDVSIGVSPAWRKTACAAFASRDLEPTYAPGEEPSRLFSYFIYDSDRPHLVSPRHAAGSSPGNPLILVRDEVLDENPDHICSSVVDAA